MGSRKNLPHHGNLNPALSLRCSLNLQKKICAIEIFGATHAGLAAYLFGLWGLPAAIVEAVAFHHTPEKSELKKFSALTAVHVANALAEESQAVGLNLDYLAAIGVAHRLDDWQDTAAELQAEQFA
jgi:HD-like signal output (HDOD) protein